MPKGLGSWAQAPLALTVAEVTFEKRGDFAEAIQALAELQRSGEYPLHQAGELQELMFVHAQDQFRIDQTKIPFSVFANAQRTLAVRALPERFAYFDTEYTDNFPGFLSRFSHAFEVWRGAAPKLTLKEVRLRTLDICIPPSTFQLEEWLRPEWRSGVSTDGSMGLAVRDAPARSGSSHVRVRDAYVAANGRVALPADLVDAPVRLPSTLAVAGAERCRVATLDLERVIRGVETTAELPAQLHTAHEDLDRAFESVFTKAALTYFRTGILEQDHV